MRSNFVWLFVAFAACKHHAATPSWFEPLHQRVVDRMARIDELTARDWSTAPVTDAVTCVAYRDDSRATTTALVKRLRPEHGDGWLALSPFTATSGGSGPEGWCLDYARDMARRPHDRVSEAEGKPCIDWILGLENVAITRSPHDDEKPAPVALAGNVDVVELASGHVRLRAAVNADTNKLDTSTLRGEGHGTTHDNAQSAAQTNLEGQIDAKYKAAFAQAASGAIACH